MSLIKTVQEEINRLYLESKTNRYITSSQGGYYYDLCSVKDKSITLEDFYKEFPYHNPNFDSEYWKQQHNRWREIWEQNKI